MSAIMYHFIGKGVCYSIALVLQAGLWLYINDFSTVYKAKVQWSYSKYTWDCEEIRNSLPT